VSIRIAVQDALKEAMKNKEQARLECLRLAKAALLVLEKSGPKDHEISDEAAIAALRAEVRKRQQSIETFEQLGRSEEVAALKADISVLEEFLPKRLSEEEVEARVRAYLAANPEVNHAGKLTGAMKKELGDLVDGKVLSTLCQRALGG